MTAAPEGRSRIIAIALGLMGERGVAGTSMRQLATACDLNVATLYHYFPSKSDLVRALLEDRRYAERFADDQPAVDPAAPPADRLVALVRYLFDQALGEESVWRVLISESIHGDPDVRLSVTMLIGQLEVAVRAWVEQILPEVADPAAAGRLVQNLLFALVVQELAIGGADPDTAARDLADAVFG